MGLKQARRILANLGRAVKSRPRVSLKKRRESGQGAAVCRMGAGLRRQNAAGARPVRFPGRFALFRACWGVDFSRRRSYFTGVLRAGCKSPPVVMRTQARGASPRAPQRGRPGAIPGPTVTVRMEEDDSHAAHAADSGQGACPVVRPDVFRPVRSASFFVSAPRGRHGCAGRGSGVFSGFFCQGRMLWHCALWKKRLRRSATGR